MTPDQERALLAATAAGLDDDVRAAFSDLLELIREGTAPRDAVDQVMQAFAGDMAGTLATALSGVMAEAVGTAAVLELRVGTVTLSQRLYSEAGEVAGIVQGIVQRHVQGFQQSRALALELFEGYGFRAPDAEPLQISRRNKALPQYMREALLSDPGLEGEFDRYLARLQVNGLTTPALRAAYTGVLDAISELEGAEGQVLLEKRLRAAFYERVRYFAQRIAQTELHRAYARREAALLMDDADVEFVQLRRAPGKGDPCICVLYCGRDLYGLGPGVYPKARAPLPPFHPYCRCVVAPRLDLTGRTAQPEDSDADGYFLRSLGLRTGAQVMGSRAKLAMVLETGRTAEDVAALGRRVPMETVGEAGRL
jgi:hypothetical protein